MGTTTNGLPYPESTDFVTDGAQAIEDLAVAVDSKTGLVKLTPTSVSGSGASIAANGDVSLAAAGTFTVNGCFTSNFANYQIVARLKTASGGAQLQFKLTAAGTAPGSADWYYTVGYTSYGGAWAKTAAGPLTYCQLGGVFNTYGSLITATVSYPQKNDYTLLTSNSNGWGSAADEQALTWGHHRLQTAYDGFSLTPSASTLTGEISIYGCN